MICPDCKCPVPDTQLKCGACLQKKARVEMMRSQQRYLGFILTGRMDIVLAGRAKQQTGLHLALMGDPDHAWCWEPIRIGFKRKRERYTSETLAVLCPKCRAAFEDLVLEQQACQSASG